MAELIDVVLSELVLDPELQPRKSLHTEKVEEYAQRMKDGACFPPIHCGRLKGGDRTLYLLDGFHRVEAIKSLGTLIVPGTVEEYDTREDMFVYAFRVNSLHGIDLTDEENDDGIIRIIQMFPGDSENVLAKKTGWSRSKIHRRIKQLVHMNNLTRPEKTVGKDGKEYPSTRPAKQPDYTLCPQCGTPIWPENKGNPDYTYTERNGQWFCSEECADLYEQEQISDEAEAITGIPDELPDLPSAKVYTPQEFDEDALPVVEPEEPPEPEGILIECIVPIVVPRVFDPKEALRIVREQIPQVIHAASKFQIPKGHIYLNIKEKNINDLNNIYGPENSEKFTRWQVNVLSGKSVVRMAITQKKFEEWKAEFGKWIDVEQSLDAWSKHWNEKTGSEVLKAGNFWSSARTWLTNDKKRAGNQTRNKSPYRDESGLTSQEGY